MSKLAKVDNCIATAVKIVNVRSYSELIIAIVKNYVDSSNTANRSIYEFKIF